MLKVIVVQFLPKIALNWLSSRLTVYDPGERNRRVPDSCPGPYTRWTALVAASATTYTIPPACSALTCSPIAWLSRCVVIA